MKPDEGGWSLRQLVRWVVSRDIEAVRKLRDGAGFTYGGERAPDFPKQQDGESDVELNRRISAYKRRRREEEAQPLKTARADIFAKLRGGKLTAIDRNGKVVPVRAWQRLNLDSPDAYKQYVYPSAQARRLWRGRAVRQSAVDAWMLNHYQEARAQGSPAPKREFAITDCRKALGATARQARESLQKVPLHLKNLSKIQQPMRTL